MLVKNSNSKSAFRLVGLNTLSQYVATVITMAVTFFLTPFLINSLSKELLGLQTLAFQALAFVGLFNSSMGISYGRAATASFSRGEYAEMNSTIGAGFWLSSLATLLFVLGTLMLAAFPQQLFGVPPAIVWDARWVILITGLSSAALILTGPWACPLYLAQQTYWNSVASVVSTAGSAAVVVVAFTIGTPNILVWVALANGFRLAVAICLLIPMARLAIPQFQFSFSLTNIVARCRPLLNLGVWSFVGGLGYLLYYATDSILISNLNELGTAQIIDYNLGQRWDPLIRMVILGFAGSLTPLLTTMVARRETARLQRTVVDSTRYAMALGLFPCIILFVFAQPFIAAWVGERFVSSSVPVMHLVLLGTIASIPSIVGYEALIATGKIGAAVVATLVGGVLNVLLGVLFVKVFHWGLWGIALAVFLTMAVRNTLYTPILVIKACQLRAKEYYAQGILKPLLGAIPLLAAALLLQEFLAPAGLVAVFSYFGICAAIYFPCVWFITLDQRDKSFARESGFKLLQKLRPAIAPVAS